MTLYETRNDGQRVQIVVYGPNNLAHPIASSEVVQSDARKVASEVQLLDINDKALEHPDLPLPTNISNPKKKSLDEIKSQLELEQGSLVSFVIIGTMFLATNMLNSIRSCRCWKKHPDGKTSLRSKGCR